MRTEQSLAGKKVAVLVETEYIFDEVQYYQKEFTALGATVTYLAYLWGKPSLDLVNDVDTPDRPVTDMHRFTVTECVTKHDPEEFDIVICAANYVAVRLREIPPMGSLGSVETTRNAPAVQFFARAMENKAIVKGAMCHALWLLTPRPDLLKGRRVICHTVVLSDIYNAGATYVPAEDHVVIDGDLVTARSAADLEAYFNAIVKTAAVIPDQLKPDQTGYMSHLIEDVTSALAARFNDAAANYRAGYRPVSLAAKSILEDKLDVAAEVKRMIGVNWSAGNISERKPILIAVSKFGAWASELSLVVGVLRQAGYQVKLATEDGSPPHLLSVSFDPSFEDGAWRNPVVSVEEGELAKRLIDPRSAENLLLRSENIFNLGGLAAPPEVGDYLKDNTLLDTYKSKLTQTVQVSEKYEALVIVGGSGAIPGFMASRGLQFLILCFLRAGKPLMGQCNGGLAIAQTIDPLTNRSILFGKAATTHSWLDEYQSGWGWTAPYTAGVKSYWKDGNLDLKAYASGEQWIQPGLNGNPLVDSEHLFKAAVGEHGIFFSPPGTPYSMVVDENLITSRTTPDGYPGVLALIARLDGNPQLSGKLFIDQDEQGRIYP